MTKLIQGKYKCPLCGHTDFEVLRIFRHKWRPANESAWEHVSKVDKPINSLACSKCRYIIHFADYQQNARDQ